jgi:hypothetical protein
MVGTIEQLMVLVMFCRRVNIPFEVFAFSDAITSGWGSSTSPFAMDYTEDDVAIAEYRHGDWVLSDRARMVNLFSSTMRAAAFTRALKGMMAIRNNHDSELRYNANGKYHTTHSIPNWMGLGGTPLDEAIVHAINFVPEFRVKYNLQIVNTVFLTDGEGAGFSEVKGKDYMNRHRNPIILKDERTRKEYLLNDSSKGWSYNIHTRTLFEILKDYAGVEVFGFFLVGRKVLAREIESLLEGSPTDKHRFADRNEIVKIMRKDGCYTFSEFKGYSDLYVIVGENMKLEESTGLDDALKGASATKLKSAFKKNSGSKVKNRVVLKRFTDKIAA